MNIGYRDRNDVHNHVQRALKEACPHSEDGVCGPNVKGKFAVSVLNPKNRKIEWEDMYVTVDSARWDKKPKIYDLLIDAVAGAADRAAWPPESCHHFVQIEKGNIIVPYNFCNTVDHIAVAFPGGYSMNVTLKSSSHHGDRFDCEKFRVKAERYGEDMQSKIAEQVGDDDLYTVATCQH